MNFMRMEWNGRVFVENKKEVSPETDDGTSKCAYCKESFLKKHKKHRFCGQRCRKKNKYHTVEKFFSESVKREKHLKYKKNKIKELGSYIEWLYFRREADRRYNEKRKIRKANKRWIDEEIQSEKRKCKLRRPISDFWF